MKKVAIIGGGMAGLTAAWYLSGRKSRGEIEVTVYQRGWRLGGKGASSRGAHGRIEEHGLHIWLGFYDNAFRLIRDCYEELKRDPRTCPLATWRDAFKEAPDVGLTQRTARGQWRKLMAHLSRNSEGTVCPKSRRPSLAA